MSSDGKLSGDVKEYGRPTSFDIDGYLKSIGEFGSYQRRFFVLLVFLSIIDGFIVVFTVITSTAPDHYCRSFQNETYVPRTQTSLCDSFPISSNSTCYTADRCLRVVLSNGSDGNATIAECDLGWVYDQSIYHSTPVAEWDLVCDKLWQRQLSKTVHMLGRPIGALLIGVSANRFGSKPVLFINTLILVGAGLLAATVNSFPVFAVSQFFTGCTGSLVNIGLIYVTELVGPSKRGTLGLLYYLGYPIAAMIMPSIASFVKDWRKLDIFLCIIFSFALSYLWIIPESVRWLLAHGRGEEAKRILLHAAVVNKATLSVDKLDEVNHLTTITNSEVSSPRPYGLMDMMRNPLMRKTVLNMCFQWSVTYAVYIGLSTNTDFLAGHDLLNMFLTGLAEVPALTLTALFVDRIGRKLASLCGYTVAGVALALVSMIPQGNDAVVVGIAVIGKFGISVGFAVVCLYTTELLPTPIRQIGVGLCSSFGRIGAAMTPMLFTLGELYWWPIPYVLFSSGLCCGALFIRTLPETTGVDLPQTMEDAEEFLRKGSKRRCILLCRDSSYQQCELDNSPSHFISASQRDAGVDAKNGPTPV
ncbi:solute carrier family 22 member 3-like isoform X2 [Anneissia japonica]|uniref:solute carrier family 22 member 3-like isoform X2 n=1 Tax=Anneissia japonica TaxID=1529436 RepID=UPI0014258B88|nr:solute carrier family 22 member 3-like isoform X2 [Anneissia japonica]